MSPTRFDDGVVIPSPSRRPEAQEVGHRVAGGGGLVGGASLNGEEFAKLAANAAGGPF